MLSKYLLLVLSYDNYLYISSYRASCTEKKKIIITNYLKYKYKNNILLYYCSYTVIPILAVLYMLKSTIIYLLKKIFCKKIKKKTFDKLFINSQNGFKVAFKKGEISSDDYVLNFPYRLDENLKCKKVEITQVISASLIMATLIDSIVVFFLLLRKRGLKSSFYSLTLFDCLLLYNALENLEYIGEIVISNQMDRWFLLIGNLPFANKTIIQHGTIILKGYCPSYLQCFTKQNKEYYYIDLLNKSGGYNKLLVFSDLEYKYMLLSVLCTSDSEIKFKIIGYNLQELTPVFSVGKICILVIGNMVYHKEEQQIIDYFAEKKEYLVVLKPHPLDDRKKYNKFSNYENLCLLEDNVCPKVSLVVSYNSTLALEYDNLNIPVIYYDDLYSCPPLISFDKLESKICIIKSK